MIIIILRKWLDSSIWPVDRTQTDTTTPGQSRPETNDNEAVLHILESYRTGASPSVSLVSYSGDSLGIVLLLCRGEVSVFYSLSRQGGIIFSMLHCIFLISFFIYLNSFVYTSLFDLKYFYLRLIICRQLYSFKYSYLILIIHSQLHGLKLLFLFDNHLFTQLFSSKYFSSNPNNLQAIILFQVINTNNFQ